MHCNDCKRDCRTALPACQDVEPYELPDELSLVYHQRMKEEEFEKFCEALGLDPEEAARDLSQLDPHAEEESHDPIRLP